MAIDRARTRTAKSSFCPECSGNLGNPETTHAVCRDCAAISIGDKGGFRMLKTSEWLDVLNLPSFWALIELRESVVEKLTCPTRK